jgi:outer membrane protein TolC
MKYVIWIIIVCFLTNSVFAQQKKVDDYIQLGLENSPLLKDFKNQQLANLIDSLKIIAGYKTQVNGVSTNNYAPSLNGWGYDYAVTNGTNFAQQIVATKKLVGKENLNNQNEAIRLLNESLNISGKISTQDLIKTISAQYITAYGVFQQINFNNTINDLLLKQQLVLKNYTEKGIYKQADYLSMLVASQQQVIIIEQLKAQFQNEVAALNYLCGIKDTNQVQLINPTIKIEPIAMVENTVYYQQFTVDSFKLKNATEQIKYNYKPKVNLYADGGYLSTFAENAYKNFGASAGVSITIPIYDGNQRKMQTDRIKIAEQTRQDYRDFFKKQYDQQILQLVQQLNATDKIIAVAEKQISYAEMLMEAQKKLVESGDARITDYIMSINNYLFAKNTITQNTINKFQLINQINYWNKK